MFDRLISCIRDLYPDKQPVPLHEPAFLGNEKRYVEQCLDSGWVSSVGSFVDVFEEQIAAYTGAAHAVAVVNGTSALQLALTVAGVRPGDEVLTQALTFVGTANAISHCGAHPIFLDSERKSLGMCPQDLEAFLQQHTELREDGQLIHKRSQRRIAACLPVHVLGLPCRVHELRNLCAAYHLPLVEDAAEGLGSFEAGRHVGTVGTLGVLSFNGNKIITSGGGGMVLTDDPTLAKKARHLSTTAKADDPLEVVHDQIGFNFRMPNLNAALACAQMENLTDLLDVKRRVAETYRELLGSRLLWERSKTTSNFWLNGAVCESAEERNDWLRRSHERGIYLRPLWKLSPDLPMYQKSWTSSLENAREFQKTIVTLPSSYARHLSRQGQTLSC